MAARPDHAALVRDLEGVQFRIGVERGYWRLVRMAWPNAVFDVAAAARARSPDWYAFLFELSNYPRIPPTARCWDPARDQPLDHNRFPTGPVRVGRVFRTDWNKGTALYHPMDRQAINTHRPWSDRYAALLWSPSRDITQFLEVIRELLNSEDYSGSRCS